VKSSTGFVGAGSNPHAVKVMLDAAKGRIKVKPAGGVHDFKTAKMYVDMGVKRIGIGYYSTPDICGKLPGKSA
jgi:deoxyribose-phosphate aldolase